MPDTLQQYLSYTPNDISNNYYTRLAEMRKNRAIVDSVDKYIRDAVVYYMMTGEFEKKFPLFNAGLYNHAR